MASIEDNAPQPTMLFIPDISGFTQFVHNTEILHSQHIIEELLEVLIDANDIGLTVSEIEGDAILFYRQGPVAPTAVEVLAQVQKMYVNFNAHLKLYEMARICQCGACSTAFSRLQLKFVVHYGDIAKKQVKEFTKLFGSDVIIAHRLMKNDIDSDEYVLLSHKLIKSCPTWVDLKDTAWSDPTDSAQTYDGVRVEYCYLPLEPLAAHVPEPRIEDYSLHGSRHMMEVEVTVNAPLEMVFDVSSDLSFRHHWNPSIKGSDKLNGKITRNGSTHRCIVKGTDNDPLAVSHSFDVSKDKVVWVETFHNHKNEMVFTLERIGKRITRIKCVMFGKFNVVQRLMFNAMMKKKYHRLTLDQYARLDEICQSLMAEQKGHTERILLEPATEDGKAVA